MQALKILEISSGDFICAAEFATQENINFMATYGKGLICTPMSEEIANKLGLPPMVSENTDNHQTAFTVSIDHIETTTGISAAERSFTMIKCADPDAGPAEFRRPGHVFPLVARYGGVLTRNGHTEATVDLMRLAGLKECGVCCEIMDDDGTMMRTPKLWELAEKFNLTFITIKQLQEYIRIVTDKSVEIQAQEARNKDLMMRKFSTVKRHAHDVRANSRAINGYYKTMKQSAYMDPLYMDGKK